MLETEDVKDAAPGETSRALPAWTERGVLVYGPRKAGTTLFQNLLDGGEHLFVYPAELKLKWFVRKPARITDLDAYRSRSRISQVDSPSLSRDRYRVLWDSALEDGSLRSLGEFIRYDAWAALVSSRAPAEVRIWCAKEVGGRTGPIVDAWRAMFPEGKVLLITRDPRMVTRAVLNDRRRQGLQLSLRQIVHETLDPMRVVTAQSRLLGDPGTLTIAYEDLVADTPGAMATVAGFLGIPYSDRLAIPTLFSEPVIVRTSSRQTKGVFRPADSWTEGLTRRERLIVTLVRSVARLLPRYAVNYAALRERLRRPPRG